MCVYIWGCIYVYILWCITRAFELFGQQFVRLEASGFASRKSKLLIIAKQKQVSLILTVFFQGKYFPWVLLPVKQLGDLLRIKRSAVWSHLCSWGRFLFLSPLAIKEHIPISYFSHAPSTHGLCGCPGTASPALKGIVPLLWRVASLLTVHPLREAKKPPSSLMFCSPPQKYVTFIDWPFQWANFQTEQLLCPLKQFS